MSQRILGAMRYGRDRIAAVAVPPLSNAYTFVFPPLQDVQVAYSGSGAMERRATDARRAALERGVVGSRSSNSHNDPDLMDAWDAFSDSPWSFVTSRYSIALVGVAIITNRIQHICRPRGRASLLSLEKRVALRLPSLMLLSRAVLIFITIVADYFLAESNLVNYTLRTCTTTSWRESWLANAPLDGWATSHFGSASRNAMIRARDASALWAGFTATCVAVITDCLVRNLDADREEPPAFNLVGFAFLLHFHSFSPDAPANQHVYVCVLLQLLHILSVSMSKCRRKPFVPRLIISSFFGILALIHYALTARSGQYPFMEAFSRTPEVALILVITLTVSLHALTMLLLEGRIEWDRLLFSRSNLPALGEDWSIALFKVGTACMESTRLTGLGREVAPLFTFDEPYLELEESGHIKIYQPAPLDETEGLGLGHKQELPSSGGLDREIKQIRVESWDAHRSNGLGPFGFARLRPAANFVLTAYVLLRNLASMGVRKACHVLGLPEPRVPRWVYRGLRLIRLAWHGQNGERRRAERLATQLRQDQETLQTQRRRAREREGRLTTYHSRHHRPYFNTDHALRFLRARNRTDSLATTTTTPIVTHEPVPTATLAPDEDEIDADFEDEASSYSDGESESELEPVEVDKAEVSGLLEEFESANEGAVTLRSGTEGFNQLLLAHLTRRSDGPPLTRSGYSSLLAPTSERQDFDLAQTIAERRPAVPRPSNSDDLRRLCVVCCVEDRNVICWPCRCLCLCMDCREHLASRPPNRHTPLNPTHNRAPPRNTEPTHLCPTCRTPVQAFSRLYIP